jgi:RNase H-like domain found in reverse transcriptase
LDNQKRNPTSSRKSCSNPKISAPTKKKELRRFIGSDRWIRGSDIPAPLAALTSKTTPWKWTYEHQRSFDQMKQIASWETLLAYPYFSKPFDVYTDSGHSQLGAAICQNDKPISFYSRKLNPAQTRYTTAERKLLAIVETLKELHNKLLGHTMRIFTDHQNLNSKNFNT